MTSANDEIVFWHGIDRFRDRYCARRARVLLRPPGDEESTLRQATYVVIAETESIHQSPNYDDTGKLVSTTEQVIFRITETIKGSRQPGEALNTLSTIGVGGCGESAMNSPVGCRLYAKKSARRWDFRCPADG
jgi:hypothetical protein